MAITCNLSSGTPGNSASIISLSLATVIPPEKIISTSPVVLRVIDQHASTKTSTLFLSLSFVAQNHFNNQIARGAHCGAGTAERGGVDIDFFLSLHNKTDLCTFVKKNKTLKIC